MIFLTIEKHYQQIKKLDYEIDNLLERRKYYYEQVTKITPAYKDINVQESSRDGSKIDTYVTLMADDLSVVTDLLNERDRLFNDLERTIDCVEDKRMVLLLKLRYLYNRTWGYIAKRVNVSESHIKNSYHEKCLKEFKKVSTKSTE